MQFTGRNLLLVHDAVTRAIADIHMDIGSCPNPRDYEEEIAALEQRKTEFERLLARIDLQLKGEGLC